MASSLKNLSSYDENSVPSAKNMKFGIVVSEWNRAITDALYQGAYQTLIKHGALADNIVTIGVPGSFELTAGARTLAKRSDVDAVICLGCVIQGDTDRKSTRLNSSHVRISYAVFCLKKKTEKQKKSQIR